MWSTEKVISQKIGHVLSTYGRDYIFRFSYDEMLFISLKMN